MGEKNKQNAGEKKVLFSIIYLRNGVGGEFTFYEKEIIL